MNATREPSALRLATAAMGTRFELAILDEDAERWRAAGEAAMHEIEDCHRRYNHLAQDSLLSHINRTAPHAPVRIDRETFELLMDADEVNTQSAGAFDITVDVAKAGGWTVAEAPRGRRMGGKSMLVSGLRAALRPKRSVAGEPPTGMAAILLDPDRYMIRLLRPDLALDLGGIAKGHALDRAAAILRTEGVTRALLHGGTSSVVAIGSPPDTDGWRIALGPDRGAPVVSLRDEALSSSSTSGRMLLAADGSRYAHIIDPRTGAPVEGERSATVIGPSARLADAWSTALVVLRERPPLMGPEWTVFLNGERIPHATATTA